MTPHPPQQIGRTRRQGGRANSLRSVKARQLLLSSARMAGWQASDLQEGTWSRVANGARNDLSPSLPPSGSLKSLNLTDPKSILLPTEKAEEPKIKAFFSRTRRTRKLLQPKTSE